MEDRFKLAGVLGAVSVLAVVSYFAIGALTADASAGLPPVGKSIGETIQSQGVEVTLEDVDSGDLGIELQFSYGSTDGEATDFVDFPQIILPNGEVVELTGGQSSGIGGSSVVNLRADGISALPIASVIQFGTAAKYGHDRTSVVIDVPRDLLGKVGPSIATPNAAVDLGNAGTHWVRRIAVNSDEFRTNEGTDMVIVELIPIEDVARRAVLVGGSSTAQLTTSDGRSLGAIAATFSVRPKEGGGSEIASQIFVFEGSLGVSTGEVTLALKNLGELVGPFQYRLDG